MNKAHGRQATPAVLVSLVAHAILLISLGLIGLNLPDATAFSISIDNLLDEAQLTELAAFEMASGIEVESSPQPLELQFAPPIAGLEAYLPPPPLLADHFNTLEAKTLTMPSTTEGSLSQLKDTTNALAVSIQRRVSQAGGKQGEIQFALAWKNTNDVDLHVIAPSGERISHLHKQSACQGKLDVDMNVRGESKQPVENVRWLSQAPWGRYTVIVNLFRIHPPEPPRHRPQDESQFDLLSQLGSQTHLVKDSVSRRNQVSVFRFHYVSEELPLPQREQLLAELAELQASEEAIAGPVLQEAREIQSRSLRERFLNRLIMQFPHTDTAIEAMRLLGGNITK